MANDKKSTPKWWQYLTAEELAFAKDYIKQKEHTAEMAEEYRRTYFRARQRKLRKEEPPDENGS